ncbi:MULTISPECIES: bifunctional diguanylate cyclase/phosphodiesterase [Micromonospora]|uniref:putative bifunctional diguanylate cyclase/phosphodiesterase n=1 Tax=Micromonospora TaxID=1873 RepID=UPI0003EEA655|nr:MULTISPECIES: bifunctional diguanylate cyclase/phosphodiesterase [unclassified Micromonospora]EWM65568.1 cyclic diguanylate phosphodiesterase (EAL) protein [Micromonospora sp. M42]MCK1808276.1 EAL domain-containing protein [Micromonospora sp. R42106]MCK1833184.1 EAL domain-containing protein [Micromonospora sp. R42003]MCK1844491.1 EAL domain-containing protein [Micromonospora sp. R42004]MCM1017525.1 EAL domain-containing protein [Micromonospora sp. XM-20-01]
METGDPRNSVPPGRSGPFFGFVGAVGVVAVLVSAGPLIALADRLTELPAAFWTMAALAVACDARPFVPPGRRQTSAVFPSTCFTFAILLGWGFGPAVAVQAVAVAVSGWRLGYAPWRTGFNAAQYACALAAAYAVSRLGPGELFGDGRLHWTDVAAVGGATLAWFVVNYGLVSSAVRLRFGDRWWPSVRSGLAYELLSTGSLLLLAPVLVAAARASAALIPLVLVPLFAVYRMARLSEEREQLADVDPLTGLPNRKALLTEVAEQVHLHGERAARGAPDAHLALLLLDLDRFKHVNDALGHAVGDRLLVEVSARLMGVVGAGDMVARLGGDEFAIVVPRLTDIDQARERADRVVAALAEPVPLDGLPLDVGGSIGIALYPDHGEDFATLMRHADVAMYDAKHRNDTVAVYAPESDHNSAERLSLLADLRRVLESGPSAQGGETVGVRGGDGAALTPALSAPRPARAERPSRNQRPARDDGRGGGRSGDGPNRWLRRRRDRAAERHDDDLIERILTGADPIRSRAARAGAAGAVVATPVVGGGDADAAETGTGRDTEAAHETDTGHDAQAAVSTGAPGVIGPTADGSAEPEDQSGHPGEITMYYQPQIAIATGEVVGVEALLRWRHPRRGMVDPGELIQVAEQSAVMRLLTRRVVDDVVEQLAKWSAAGLTLRAALNVSVRDLHTGEIADQIADRLARYGVPPQRLQVEITEGALMADPRRVLASITQLHRIGVGIALDDFGTGYSSLQHLRRLPLSEVKVDRSFVLGMADDPDDAAIVRSMIELAGALGLRVVAEGVEDERTWRLLHAAGCDVAQGWFHARPMPAEDLVAWLSRYRPVRPVEAGSRSGAAPEGEAKASS